MSNIAIFFFKLKEIRNEKVAASSFSFAKHPVRQSVEESSSFRRNTADNNEKKKEYEIAFPEHKIVTTSDRAASNRRL